QICSSIFDPPPSLPSTSAHPSLPPCRYCLPIPILFLFLSCFSAFLSSLFLVFSLPFLRYHFCPFGSAYPLPPSFLLLQVCVYFSASSLFLCEGLSVSERGWASRRGGGCISVAFFRWLFVILL